ncbi:FAD:protein FMN transferase [Rhodococcus sp. NPDC003318]|uniref:FAD:protein FMN transferase n=1 Tax=Rhodococcus sp. NPDC003318 TaxID=3364503 RepID=UPI00368274B5
MSGGDGTRRCVEQVMGMPISLALRGRHAADDAGLRAWHEVLESLREADRLFSSFRADSFVSRLIRGEEGTDRLPPAVAEVFALGDRAERESGGAFAIRRPGPAGGTVLDPCGVVKGWAVERAAEFLRALDETDFCLSAGGDMTCRTHDPAAAPWRIGIENPLDTSRLVAVVPIHTGAVATSGTAHRGSHLVDARTGRPPTGVASVTVIGESLTWADIDATAAYARGADAARWLSSRPDPNFLVVWADGSTATPGCVGASVVGEE